MATSTKSTVKTTGLPGLKAPAKSTLSSQVQAIANQAKPAYTPVNSTPTLANKVQGIASSAPQAYTPTLNTQVQSIASKTSGASTPVPQASLGGGGGGGGILSTAGSAISGAYNALKNALTKPIASSDGSASADNGVSNMAGVGALGVKNTTYKGAPGTETTTYSASPSGSTLAGQVKNEGGITPEEREANKQFAATAEQERLAKLAAAQTEAAKIKAAIDAAAATETTTEDENDPFLATLRAESEERNKQFENLQKQIEDLSKESPEEAEAKAKENELIAKEAAIKSGVQRSAAEISAQPIPYGFITGQKTAIERAANADLDTIAAQKIPLQQRLATEQAKRAAALDVAKSAVSRVSSVADRASNRAFDYELDEKKRKKQSDAEIEKEKRENANKLNEPYTLTPGQTRYVGGKAVASVPAAPKVGGSSGANYTATNIPNDVQVDLTADINTGASLAQLYEAYPDVSPAFIRSHFNSLRSTPSGSTASNSSRPK